VGDHRRERVLAGTKLLDLGVVHLAAFGEVREHATAHLARLVDHRPAVLLHLLDRGVRRGARVADDRQGFRLGAVAELLARGFRLGDDAGGMGLGLGEHLVRRGMRRVEDLRRLGTKRGRNRRFVDLRFGGAAFGLGEAVGELLLAGSRHPDELRDVDEEAVHGLGVVPAPDDRELAARDGIRFEVRVR